MYWSLAVDLTTAFLVLILAQTTGSSNGVRLRWQRCFKEQASFLAFYNISVKDCALKCARNPKCEFLGYKPRMNVCEFYKKNDTEKLGRDQGNTCIFINRKHLRFFKVRRIVIAVMRERNKNPTYLSVL